jgi:hypothetical protein
MPGNTKRNDLAENFTDSILDEACSKRGVVNPPRNGLFLHSCVNGHHPGISEVKLKFV